MNLEQLEDSNYKIYDVIAGSHMYGLNIPTSDIDHRGLFNLPIEKYILHGAPKQVACDMNDSVYYEVGRFLQLAASANPNILEIMFAPERSVVYKHHIMDMILKHRDKFLTKACAKSLGGYAGQQIHKARVQNKMVTKPMVKRKTVLDFCYVNVGGEESISLKAHLAMIGRKQSDIALTKINNFQNTYRAYHKGLCSTFDSTAVDCWVPRGIVKEGSEYNELRLTSIPEIVVSDLCSFVMSYNKDGYTAHCRDYKKYTDWVAKRNPARYETNLETLKDHKKFYDKKNMMHCMRLLNMGTELALTGKLNVERPDREYLLGIRNGKLPYDDILNAAEAKIIDMEEAFKTCDLPDSVEQSVIDNILLEIKLSIKS